MTASRCFFRFGRVGTGSSFISRPGPERREPRPGIGVVLDDRPFRDLLPLTGVVSTVETMDEPRGPTACRPELPPPRNAPRPGPKIARPSGTAEVEEFNLSAEWPVRESTRGQRPGI